MSLRKRILKLPIMESSWAKTEREKILVIRRTREVEQELTFDFIGKAGWTENGRTFESCEYIGWRETGVNLGDGDAWLTIYKNPEGIIGFTVFGFEVTVYYDGAEVTPTKGPYFFRR